MKSKRNKFASYELAKILKENGYDELTYYRVDDDDSLATNGMLLNWNDYDEFYSSPSLNEIADWLLDKMKIYIEIYFIQKNYDYGCKFTYDIIDTTKSLFSGSIIMSSKNDFSTKEEALNDAINKYFNKIVKKEKMPVLINKNKIEIID